MTSIHLRDMTLEERTTIEKIAHSRTAPACMVERAQIIWQISSGVAPASIANRLHIDVDTVYRRIQRFNMMGLDALKDKPRSGRPTLYTADQIATVLDTARTKPSALGLPFDAWTLDRLAGYLHQQKGIAIQRSRIDEILLREGLRRQRSQSRSSVGRHPTSSSLANANTRETKHELAKHLSSSKDTDAQ
ncbi:helix-turn-helix domain-containing protein [Microvirga makkahensis]|uniref:Helix-turn-helix domain-containing protein n=1 Tax=Microvirga makkahensis TaxID=1128670 RepID=A0A7X3MTV0_9HYPH|nr:helix-turn-helix domain-containing protein [Microvirga makkahensis]MXQ13102.1 helix-turn-helix domain-containing protein [Microvirga makkahensis]